MASVTEQRVTEKVGGREASRKNEPGWGRPRRKRGIWGPRYTSASSGVRRITRQMATNMEKEASWRTKWY
jgi:hypothetical protein